MDHERPQSTPRVIEHQRAYKACIPCRKRKAKCDLGGRDGPPCVRCRRELRECIFSAERSWTKKRKLANTTDTDPSIRAEPQRQYSSQSEIPHSASYSDTRVLETNNGPRNSNLTFIERDGLANEVSSVRTLTPDLTRSVMRTVVSNGNDALNLLFEAAAQDQDNHLQPDPTNHITFDPPSANNAAIPMSAHIGANVVPAPMSPVSPELQKFWKSSKFVKMGWLTAQEIVTYIDLFFKNLNPLSPALSYYYANHTNQYRLADKEPLLCSAILMISSRYHVLAGPGGASRAYFVHERFWKFCQHLITRMLYGQEKGSNAKTRTLGSIEALLLLSEWHPRSLHFPPEADGWDSDLIIAADDEPETTGPNNIPNRWLEDVIEPAKRSDRMSWMLLGCALSLAHELNLFGQAESGTDDDNMLIRKSRARKLLYVFTTQLASRLGITSMLPQNLTHIISHPREGQFVGDNWDTHMLAWIELTKLLKSLSEMVFPSKVFTQQLLHSGRYVGILEHFQPLLLQWKNTYLDDQDMPEAYRDVLTIEYQYVRVYCNSIGMQAVCERALAGQASKTATPERPPLSFDADDQAYIQEVIAGSCDMLEKAIMLAHKDTLKFAPVRVFLRITTASIFLLKAISISVRNSQLKTALGVLHRSVQALRSSVLDDMHLANSYAALLEIHIKRLQKSFLKSTKRALPSSSTTRLHSVESSGDDIRRRTELAAQGYDEETSAEWFAQLEDWDRFSLNLDSVSSTDNDWLALPFDPAMAPFATFPTGMDDGGLSFIWNLPT